MRIVSTRFVLLLWLVGLASCTFDTSNASGGSDGPGTRLDASLPDAAPPCQSTGQPGVDVSESLLELVEGGPNLTYELSLRSKPCSIVHVTIDGGAELLLSTTTAMFAVAQWDQPQTITVAAVHDFVPEGAHTAMIVQQVVSSDQSYGGLTVDNIAVSIADRAHLTLISIGLDNEGAEDHCDEAVVSNSGRYVAFTSEADNLVPNGNNNSRDIFLRDVVLGTTTRITNDGNDGGDNDSDYPAISSDGQHVVFFSTADEIATGSTSFDGEIFHYDVATMRTTIRSASCSSCNSDIEKISAISGHENIVAYNTNRTLVAGDNDNAVDAYVSDGADVTLASLSTGGQSGNSTPGFGSDALNATLSASGQFLGFRSPAGGLGVPEINNASFHSYVKNRASGLLTRVSVYSGGGLPCGSGVTRTDSSQPYISADGNLAAFDSECNFDINNMNDGNTYTDIFVRDIAAETTTRVNESPNGAPANGDSKIIGISDDGNFIAFTSEATNLVASDTNGRLDLFVYDRTTNETTRASLGRQYVELSDGIVPNTAHMSRDGKYVVFTTTEQLVDADVSNDRDVYRVQLR